MPQFPSADWPAAPQRRNRWALVGLAVGVMALACAAIAHQFNRAAVFILPAFILGLLGLGLSLRGLTMARNERCHRNAMAGAICAIVALALTPYLAIYHKDAISTWMRTVFDDRSRPTSQPDGTTQP